MKNSEVISAIIVIYYPVITDLIKLVNSSLEQVDKVFIIDNTPNNEDMSSIEDLFMRDNKIEYIRLGFNAGIGAAHNIGLEASFNQSYEAVLILDQDSIIPVDFVRNLMEVSAYLDDKYRVACIGPSVFNRDTKKNYSALIDKGTRVNNGCKEVTSIISSGSIIFRDAYIEVGGMEEELFIDNVDFEWCWRARSKGYSVFVALNVHMEHRVGDGDINIFNIFSLHSPNPIRHYYQFRNTILLMRRDYTPLYFKLRSIALMPIEIIVYTLLVSPRRERVKMICEGIIHGLERKTGERV